MRVNKYRYSPNPASPAKLQEAISILKKGPSSMQLRSAQRHYSSIQAALLDESMSKKSHASEPAPSISTT